MIKSSQSCHISKKVFELISIQKESKENLAGKLKILPINDRICLRKAKLMYRIANNSAPEYLQSILPTCDQCLPNILKFPNQKRNYFKKVSNTLELCSGIVFQLRLEMPTLFPFSKPSIYSGFRNAAKIINSFE